MCGQSWSNRQEKLFTCGTALRRSFRVNDAQISGVKAWAAKNGVALPDTPAGWVAAKFPKLLERFGSALQEFYPADDNVLPSVKDLSEDFFGAILGELGLPHAPTVFVAAEERFYSYSTGGGIYGETREAILASQLSDLLLECARACSGKFNTESLQFKLRDSANLKGVLTRAKGLLQVGQD